MTVIFTDTPPSPTRSEDLFARSMSTKLFQSIKESTAPPSPMPFLPGGISDYDRIVTLTSTLVTDEAELPLREPIARNASANESSLSLLKQSLKVPLGYLHSRPTWRISLILFSRQDSRDIQVLYWPHWASSKCSQFKLPTGAE